MRDRPGLWRLSALFLVGAAAAAGGCGLVLNYGDFSGTGGSASATGAGAASGSMGAGASVGSMGAGASVGSVGSTGPGVSVGSSTSAGTMGASTSAGSTSSGGCQGTCLPPKDGTWTPVLFLEGAAKPCPMGASPVTGGTGATGVPAICTACTCGTPSCGTTYTLDLWKSSGACSGNATSNANVNFNQCETVPASNDSFMLQEPMTACAPDGGAATRESPTWATSDQTCPATITGSCSSGEACVPTTTGFTACISAGPIAAPGPDCPDGGPTKRTVFSTLPADTRGCSTCTCAGTQCSQGLVEIAQDVGCGMQLGPSPFAQCYDAGNPALTVVVPPAPIGGAVCSPSGGASVGSVTDGTQVVVVCCP